MAEPPPPAGTLRDRQKAQTHEAIVDALMEALAAGELDKATHDALARRTGVSRQTVYRHFPDRESLMQAVWGRINSRVSATAAFPTDEPSLSNIAPLYANFDKVADLIVIANSTPQGRAVRRSVKAQRAAAFRKAAAAATAGLTDEEAEMACAVLQLLHGGQAWMELREQWDLTAEQSAAACEWAVRTLLADLHARKGRSLRNRGA